MWEHRDLALEVVLEPLAPQAAWQHPEVVVVVIQEGARREAAHPGQ